MALEAQSPKGRLEKWTGENWGPGTTDRNQNFSNLDPHSQQTLSAKSSTFSFGSCLFLWTSVQASIRHIRSRESNRVRECIVIGWGVLFVLMSLHSLHL